MLLIIKLAAYIALIVLCLIWLNRISKAEHHRQNTIKK